MNAMIFAAGLGTRLRPLTDEKPKALVEINGRSLLEINISRMVKAGIHRLVVNVHHFAPQVIAYLKQHNGFGAEVIISDESDMLLDTGGGLKKAASHFLPGEPILIYNVDVISDIDIKRLIQFHKAHQALATLAVRQRNSSRVLLFDDQELLRGWRNNATGELKSPLPLMEPDRLIPLAFSGIQVIDPAMPGMITETGKFSMIEVYLRLCAVHPIRAYRHDSDYWSDVGKLEELKAAEHALSQYSI